MMGPRTSRNTGFTLVELVVAIVLTAIVVGFSTMFLTAPVDTYYTQSRRAELADYADSIKRRMSDDLRLALPNSVRINVSGTRAIVEMLVAEQVAFYRGDATVGDPARELSINVTDAEFATLGRIYPAPGGAFTLMLPSRYRLSVNNLGISGSNAYQSTNVITPGGTQIELSNGGAAGEEDHIRLTPGFRFTSASPSNRLFLVSGPVAYICNSAANARTVRRYENYTITAGIPASEAAAQLNVAGVVSTVVARDVTACQLRCSAGSTAPCSSALVVDLTLSRANNTSNESIKVFTQLPVENTT